MTTLSSWWEAMTSLWCCQIALLVGGPPVRQPHFERQKSLDPLGQPHRDIVDEAVDDWAAAAVIVVALHRADDRRGAVINVSPRRGAKFDELAASVRDGDRTLAVSRATLDEDIPSKRTTWSAQELSGHERAEVGQGVAAHGRARLDRQALRETLAPCLRTPLHVH